jgi:glycine/D-amino acid oxidase-like deaminating enzyme
MPLALLKYGLNPRYRDAPHFRWQSELKPRYDVVVIGAGGHGPATAYYLASRHGTRDIAVLDRGWLGGGNTARNTTIVRSNYLTPDGVAFYKESVDLSRAVLQALETDIDLAAAAFPFMGVRTGRIGDIPVRMLRVGFVGELGYELHCPAGMGEALWDRIAAAGAPFGIKPFGVEAQRILRLEKAISSWARIRTG